MRSKGKIFSVSVSLALIAGLGLTGCSGGQASSASSATSDSSSSASSASSDSGKAATVTFWGASVTSERQPFFTQFAADVHKKYPTITVDFLAVPGDLSDYRQKLDMAVSAGTAPDITNDFRPQLVMNGYYQNLDDYFSGWAGKGSVNPQLLTSNKTYDPTGKHLYALPYSSQTWNAWARVDWLKAAGLGTPTTWPNFFTDVQKLTDKSKGQYGLSIRGGAGSANTLEMLMYSYSGLTNYFDANGKATINNADNVKFVEQYLGSYNVYTPQDDLTKGWTQLAATFQSGKAAFVFHNLGSASDMVKAFSGDYSKFAAMPFPASVKGYIVHPALMPLGLSMSSKSKDKDAAWKVMTMYLSTEENEAYCKLYGEIPANKDAAQSDFFKNTPYMKVGVDLETSSNVKFNDTPYYLPEYSAVQSQMEPLIQKVMSKQMTAQAMLDQWAQLLEKAKSDYDATKK